MTVQVLGQRGARRDAAVQDVLDGAWVVMAREGVAALSMRELARDLGVRPQSLSHYFPSKAALLDALFADGFQQLRSRLRAVVEADDPIHSLVATVTELLTFCTTNPARYHLMLQRTVPGFAPSDASHQIALETLGALHERLTAAGVTDPGDVDAVRGLINGLAAEQIANDPTGTRFIDQAPRAVRALVAGLTTTTTPLTQRSEHARRRTAPRAVDRPRPSP